MKRSSFFMVFVFAAALAWLVSQPVSAVITVSPGGDLQAAINAAVPGDTIVLTSGATYTGNFVLPVTSGSTFITITSSANVPAEGVRVVPGLGLAKIQAKAGGPAISTAASAHHWKLVGLELLPNPGGFGDIVDLGDGGPAQNTLALVPHDLVVDRCYLHGDPVVGQKRGIGLNSASTNVVNSYISGMRAPGQDSQAIGGQNGPGPFTIANNYLEAASENFMLGGGDPSIPNLVPSDVTITRNLFSKPRAWMGQTGWNVKNLFELKNAQRVVIDGNIFEYNWADAQSGYAIALTVRNQDKTAPWSAVQHVQFTNNIVRHAGAGINILGMDNNAPSQIENDIQVRNNLFEDISSKWGGQGRWIIINGGTNITVDHNTVLQDGDTALYSDTTPTTGFAFTNNILQNLNWAILSTVSGVGNATIATQFPNGLFAKNVIVGASAASYPANNYYPATMGAVGFVNFVALTGGDYHLAPTSPYRGAATDGKDVGADLDAINALVSGNGPAVPVPAPAPTPTPTPTPTPLPVPAVVSAPYKLPAASLTLTVQAEDVDTGGEGVAYHDLTPGNEGGAYRPTDAIDIEPTTDTGGGYDLGWIQAGEWVQYTVTLPAASYTLALRVACLGQGGTFHVEEAGKNLTGSLTVPNTGGWQKWTTLSKSIGSLSAGVHTFRIVMDTSGPNAVGNLNWFTLTGSQK